MRHLRKILLSLTIITMVLGLTPTYIHAGITDPEIVLSADAGAVSGLVSSINQEYKDICGKSELLRVEDKTVYILKEEYNSLSETKRERAMEMALLAISNSSLPTKERNRLYNFVAEQDTAVSSMVRQLSSDVDADFARGYGWFKPFSGTLSTAMGFFAILTCSLLGVTIVIDICYIAIPPFQMFLGALGKNKDRPRPKFVSHEAYTSVNEAETGSEYRNALSIYAGKKIKMFFAVALCLLYLSSGNIYKVVAWVMNALEGLLPQF